MSNEGYVNEKEIFPKNIITRTGEIKMAHGTHTTVAGVDTLVTGLGSIVACVVTPNDDPIDAAMFVTCDIGDQAGSPAAGSVLINSWMITSNADVSLKIATTFSKDVNWIAFGY